MLSFAFLLLQGATAAPPTPTAYEVLRAEHARGADMHTLRAALQRGDTLVQRLAVRAVGRMEREALMGELMPLLQSPAASVRREVLLASAQMRVAGIGWTVLSAPRPEPDASVRAAAYATMGRSAPPTAEWEARIAAGLRDEASAARLGAARGLEVFYRRHRRALVPADSVTRVLERLQEPRGEADRALPLLVALARHAALLASPAGSVPSASWLAALRAHPDPQVRRVAVLVQPTADALRDPSPLVRMEMLRPTVPLTTAQLSAALSDMDDHVRLMAIDRLPRAEGAATLLRPLLQPQRDWRTRAHAVAALARVHADSARPHIVRLARDPVWQARAWAARAAMVARDSVTLRLLARDPNPNVQLEAIVTAEDAVRALGRDHAGLVLAGATFLAKAADGGTMDAHHADAAARAFERISRTHAVTWRDPRVALLRYVVRFRDVHPPVSGLWLGQWLRDADPEIQRIAGEALPGWNTTADPYVPPPFAGEAELRALRGATVEMRIRGKGRLLMALHPDSAPMAVVSFVRLAERGDFAARTLHRVVPNFVVQGGSPGADEYDPATSYFMRDEVGASNRRGTLGISTRGRDTGDGQIYFNLIDNVRLDFDYTVFASVVEGLEVMDRIQEGDVIESVRVVRTASAARRSTGGVR
jgi:cyclophilin family peptidyl-prolyl cis-trans isomerase/HEAT repeat protein